MRSRVSTAWRPGTEAREAAGPPHAGCRAAAGSTPGARSLRRGEGGRTLALVLGALAAALALALPPVEGGIEGALRTAPPGAVRADEATRPLLDAPYLASPLGEGGGRDPDARFRLDAFDCMTLVETAVALGSAASLEEARLALDDVRYRGRPAYAARNHEVLSQWIPANVAKGWIAEAALPRAGGRGRRARKEYTADAWRAVRAAGRAIPGVPAARLPTGRFAVSVVPPAELPALAPHLAGGTLVFVVRRDAPDRATLVTHAGLVVRRGGGPALVRHASRSKGVRRVVEEPIERFLLRQQRAVPRWPVEGLAFFAVRDNRERVRALVARAAPAVAGERPPAAPAPRS